MKDSEFFENSGYLVKKTRLLATFAPSPVTTPSSLFVCPSSLLHRKKMVGVAGSLTNTVLLHRLKHLFPTKLTTFPTIRQLRQHKKLQFHFISANFTTTHFNSHKTQLSKVENGDNLVVLGIETSCDDTAVAVVSLHILVFLCVHFIKSGFYLFLCSDYLYVFFFGGFQVRGNGEILSQVVSSQV